MKSPVTSYAALGVGLAIMLTVGLTAISGMFEQSAMQSSMQADRQVIEEPQEEARTEMESAPAAAPEAGQADVSSEAQIGEKASKASEMEETTRQEQFLATEPPSSPFGALSIVMPYAAAAIVGSVVFVVVRKRVGW